VFYNGAKPYKDELHSIQAQDYLPQFDLEERTDGVYLIVDMDASVEEVRTQLVTTSLLGSTIVSEALFERRDGLPYRIDRDYFGAPRNKEQPGVGPFESLRKGSAVLKIW
jgi:hypothetical protein